MAVAGLRLRAPTTSGCSGLGRLLGGLEGFGVLGLASAKPNTLESQLVPCEGVPAGASRGRAAHHTIKTLQHGRRVRVCGGGGLSVQVGVLVCGGVGGSVCS